MCARNRNDSHGVLSHLCYVSTRRGKFLSLPFLVVGAGCLTSKTQEGGGEGGGGGGEGGA